ncbi:hypothetical protein N9M66_03965 [Litoreibacter sp.]|nr:hypothetical protein [Litoreibacter sp.]
MLKFSTFNKVAVTVGFFGSLIGISEWVGYLRQAPNEPVIKATSDMTTPTPEIPYPAGSDEARLAALLANNITCDGVSIGISAFARKETPAAETSSGQPATYLEVSILSQLGDQAEPFQAIGNGRGPGREGQAFLRLSQSVKQIIAETFEDCNEG